KTLAILSFPSPARARSPSSFPCEMLWGIYVEAIREFCPRNPHYKGVPFWYESTRIPCSFCPAPRDHPYYSSRRKIPQDLAGVAIARMNGCTAGSEAGDPKRD